MPTNSTTYKGFIKDFYGNKLLPITRGELILDSEGQMALASDLFAAVAPVKDANGNITNPGHAGLMTAAEKAMLNGGSGGQSLSDVYSKLNTISNSCITIRNSQDQDSTLQFYTTTDNVLTNVPVVLKESSNISLTSSNGVTVFDLKDIAITNDLDETRIKDIVVDSKGRVVKITHESISNEELPDTILGKVLDECVINSIASEEKNGTSTYKSNAIVPKSYIDNEVKTLSDKIAQAEGIATGALVFVGLISNPDDIAEMIKTPNTYYKVSGNWDIPKRYLWENITSEKLSVKTGDTLIVKSDSGGNKIIYIPSADDITAITVQNAGTNVLSSVVGDVTLNFSSLFNLTTPTNGTTFVTVDIPQANNTTSGYLSTADWNRFNSYVSQSLSYTTNITTETLGYYEIGKLSYGNTEITLLGQNFVSSLSLVGGSDNSVNNPRLQFSDTSIENPVLITLKGQSGIGVVKSDDEVLFTNLLKVDDDSSNYLEIDSGWQLKVKKGSIDETFKTKDAGLVDTEILLNTIAGFTTSFETITNSLTSNTADLRYGSDKLKAAVNCDI